MCKSGEKWLLSRAGTYRQAVRFVGVSGSSVSAAGKDEKRWRRKGEERELATIASAKLLGDQGQKEVSPGAIAWSYCLPARVEVEMERTGEGEKREQARSTHHTTLHC